MNNSINKNLKSTVKVEHNMISRPCSRMEPWFTCDVCFLVEFISSFFRRDISFFFETSQLSHEKNPPTFHHTGCLIGILILVYYNPYITG